MGSSSSRESCAPSTDPIIAMWRETEDLPRSVRMRIGEEALAIYGARIKALRAREKAMVNAGVDSSSSDCDSDCECSACEEDDDDGSSAGEHDWKLYNRQRPSQAAYGQQQPIAHESYYDPPAYSPPTSASLPPQPSNNVNNTNSAVVWQKSPDGPIVDISFTPGGEHVVAVVKTSGSLGAAHEFRIWEARSARPVHVQDQSQQGRSGMGGSGFYGSSFRDYPTPNPSISGSFIMSPCWREAFLRPDNQVFSPELDFVDLGSRAIVPFEVPGKMSLPIAASPNPGYIMGFDQVLAGVDSVCKSVIHIVGKAKNGVVLDKSYDLRCGEINHLTFTSDGAMVLSLSKYGVCRWTDIDCGAGDGIHIMSRHPSDMLHSGHMKLPSCTSPSGYDEFRHIVSVWSSEVAVWRWVPHQDGEISSRLDVYDLNEVLGRRLTALCISPDGLYIACASDDGFDIIEVVTGKWVMGTSSWRGGPFGICKGAFSPSGRGILLCTQERTIYWHKLDGLY